MSYDNNIERLPLKLDRVFQETLIKELKTRPLIFYHLSLCVQYQALQKRIEIIGKELEESAHSKAFGFLTWNKIKTLLFYNL